jgi:hypothetical protein
MSRGAVSIAYTQSLLFIALLTAFIVCLSQNFHLVSAILTWYCYDYLTPSDFNLAITAGPDWAPYQHGISTSRYSDALSFQAPATLFSFAFLEAKFRGRSVKPVLFAVVAIAVAVSVVWGYGMTRDQIEIQNRLSH